MYNSVPRTVKRTLLYYNASSIVKYYCDFVMSILSFMSLLFLFFIVFHNREFTMELNESDNDKSTPYVMCRATGYCGSSITIDFNGTDEQLSIYKVTAEEYNQEDIIEEGRLYKFTMGDIEEQKEITETMIQYVYRNYMNDNEQFNCYINGTLFDFNGVNNNSTITVWKIRPSNIAIFMVFCMYTTIGCYTVSLVLFGSNCRPDEIQERLRQDCLDTSYGFMYRENGVYTVLFSNNRVITANGITNTVRELLPDIPEPIIATNSDSACVICCDYECTVKIEPCGHICLCLGCYREMINLHGHRNCPMCRQKIESVSAAVVL